MRRILVALLLATTSPGVVAAEVAVPAPSLQATADQLFTRHAKPGAPGAAVIVLRDGEPS